MKLSLLPGLRLLRRMNWWMLLAILALLVIGVFFIYSAGNNSLHRPTQFLYMRQIRFGLMGIGVYLAFALLDYRHFRKLAWPVYFGSLFLLVMVLVFGEVISGARRWLTVLPGVSIQPSELAKVALILLLARRLSRPGINLGQVKPLLGILGLVAVPLLLILAEPDLGTSVVLLPVAGAMMFVAGMPFRILGILLAVGLTLMGIVLACLFVPRALGADEVWQKRIMSMVMLSDYHRKRLEVFVAADADPLDSGWNKRQSEIAVGSGGMWGKGFRQGTQNILGFLPRSVAPTDFIYSVIAEEMGFAGSVSILLLFVLVLLGCIQAALMAPDKLGRLLCSGVATLLFVHVVVNIAMTVGYMPITGLPLPLLSYGGSFIVMVMSALGMVQSVRIRAARPQVVFEQSSLWRNPIA